MNYAALSIEELAVRAITDPAARAYAGENFRALMDRQWDEWQEQLEDGSPHYPYDLNVALTYDHDAIPHDSIWWEI